MTVEEEIELAILLSKQEMENCGEDYLDANWHAMLMEDEQLAVTIHESECDAALKKVGNETTIHYIYFSLSACSSHPQTMHLR